MGHIKTLAAYATMATLGTMLLVNESTSTLHMMSDTAGRVETPREHTYPNAWVEPQIPVRNTAILAVDERNGEKCAEDFAQLLSHGRELAGFAIGAQVAVEHLILPSEVNEMMTEHGAVFNALGAGSTREGVAHEEYLKGYQKGVEYATTHNEPADKATLEAADGAIAAAATVERWSACEDTIPSCGLAPHCETTKNNVIEA